MTKYPGTFIVVDGIDGSGKSTLVRNLAAHLTTQGKRIFDIGAWHETHSAPPEYADAKEYDIVFAFEPSKTWIGNAIRQEIAVRPNTYSARMQAEAFALDRAIQLNRLIIPALLDGKIVIQDRSVTTSLVYQGHTDPALTMQDVATISGNQLALTYAPQHLIALYVDPATSLARRDIRKETSNQMYEDEKNLIYWQEIFHGEAFRALMEGYGTQLHRLDTSDNLDSTTSRFNSLINSLIHL